MALLEHPIYIDVPDSDGTTTIPIEQGRTDVEGYYLQHTPRCILCLKKDVDCVLSYRHALFCRSCVTKHFLGEFNKMEQEFNNMKLERWCDKMSVL